MKKAGQPTKFFEMVTLVVLLMLQSKIALQETKGFLNLKVGLLKSGIIEI